MQSEVSLMQDVAGKVAFISGAASGIGFGMAQAFASAGMKVALADIDRDALDRAVKQFGPTAAGIFPVHLDVADIDAWEAAAEQVEHELGPVSVLCNNAGITTGHASVSDLSAARWDLMMRVNVGGVFNGAHTFVKRFQSRGGEAHIVNTASIIGLFGNVKHDTSYTTCKFGIIGFSEALLFELQDTGIGVSVLCPAGVATSIALHSLKNQPSGESHPQHPEKVANRHATLSRAMRPRSVGEHVLKAIRNNTFFIITHPEYRPVVEARMRTLRAAFQEPAQPGYRENFRGPGGSWLAYSRSVHLAAVVAGLANPGASAQRGIAAAWQRSALRQAFGILRNNWH
jgi:NAD(P)-dependent dehydrogenase (short-subunit alcohol dehydrogenase family)